MDLPDNFTPESVAPIIRFMYSGRLDVKTGMFSKLHSTANLMQVNFLFILLVSSYLYGFDHFYQKVEVLCILKIKSECFTSSIRSFN